MVTVGAAAGAPVAVVAGQVSDGLPGEGVDPDGAPGNAPAPCAVVALADLAGGTAGALARPRRWLRQAGQRLASDIGAESSPG